MDELFAEYGKNEYAIQELELQLEKLYQIRIDLRQSLEKMMYGDNPSMDPINGSEQNSQGIQS